MVLYTFSFYTFSTSEPAINMLKQQIYDSTGQIILHNYNACLTSGIKKIQHGVKS